MKSFYIRTRYLDDHAVLFKGRYADGSTALRLLSDIGEPLSTPTVCMVDYEAKPEEGNVFVKDWAENEGMLHALQNAGIVGPTIREIPAGPYGCIAYECKLLAEANEL
jgi:hypothetical protein